MDRARLPIGSHGCGHRPVNQAITLQEVVSAFWIFAEGYYRTEDGATSPHLVYLRLALKIVIRLYGTTPLEKFGPLALKTVRAEMLQPHTYTDPKSGRQDGRPDWSRHYTNHQVG